MSNIAGQVSPCQKGRESHGKLLCYDDNNILWQQRLQLSSKWKAVQFLALLCGQKWLMCSSQWALYWSHSHPGNGCDFFSGGTHFWRWHAWQRYAWRHPLGNNTKSHWPKKKVMRRACANLSVIQASFLQVHTDTHTHLDTRGAMQKNPAKMSPFEIVFTSWVVKFLSWFLFASEIQIL